MVLPKSLRALLTLPELAMASPNVDCGSISRFYTLEDWRQSRVVESLNSLQQSIMQILTADTSRIATSSGIRTVAGTIESSWPPIKLPAIDPKAIKNTNRPLFRSTLKLWSWL